MREADVPGAASCYVALDGEEAAYAACSFDATTEVKSPGVAEGGRSSSPGKEFSAKKRPARPGVALNVVGASVGGGLDDATEGIITVAGADAIAGDAAEAVLMIFPQHGKITPLGATLRAVCPPYKPSGVFFVVNHGSGHALYGTCEHIAVLSAGASA